MPNCAYCNKWLSRYDSLQRHVKFSCKPKESEVQNASPPLRQERKSFRKFRLDPNGYEIDLEEDASKLQSPFRRSIEVQNDGPLQKSFP